MNSVSADHQRSVKRSPAAVASRPRAVQDARPMLHTFDHLRAELAPTRARLLAHPLYTRIDGLESLRVFQEHHVFAVWDFMSLLKALQRHLTCVDVPWTPRASTTAARFVNEIVLGEESDELEPGRCVSHFELYRAAMRETGARTDSVDLFIAQVAAGSSVDSA